MARGIVNLDKVQAGTVGNLESVQHDAELENGMFVVLGDLLDGEREVHEVEAVTDAEQELLLHASPEIRYSSLEQGLENFFLEAGRVGRAYHLTAGDTFTVTDNMIEGETVVGEYVVPQDGELKLQASATPEADFGEGAVATRFVGRVVEKTTLGYEHNDATVIKVEKA